MQGTSPNPSSGDRGEIRFLSGASAPDASASFVTRIGDRLMSNAVRAIALLVVLAAIIIAIPFLIGGVIVIVVVAGVLLLGLYIRLWLGARRRARAGLDTTSARDVPLKEGDIRENVRVRTPRETIDAEPSAPSEPVPPSSS